MKIDLHVHSWHSGMFDPPLNRLCRESYSKPMDVYTSLKNRGMDLVTLTDHDSIDGAEALRQHPDFFVSEEVTCKMPSGTLAHIGVYDLRERDHVEIQRRRDDLPNLLAYLSERRLAFSANHIFSGLTGRRELEDFDWFEGYFPMIEARNGQMLRVQNRLAEDFAARTRKVQVAGSDAHALSSVGSTYTEVPGATNKDEFLAGLRAGKAISRGENGGYFKLTRDVLTITGQMFWHNPRTAIFGPLATLVPLATLANTVNEVLFARRWSARMTDSDSNNPNRSKRGPRLAEAST